jgi:AAHS family 4-hydroxybenzoate transporter-like MFS transporter
MDHGPWSPMQRIVVMLAALAIVMDGFDSQLIGFAIPVLIKEWGVTRADFAPVVALGLIGMGVGSVLAGYVGDRLGRRSAVIGSVLVFGSATVAIGFAPNLTMLGLLRFIAGLGIGGAMPSATIMAGEYTPLRYRTLAVTAAIVCVPVGGMIAGLFASEVLPALGWRALFLIGGAMPVVLGAILLFVLPESPRWLSRHPLRWPELVGLLRRMKRTASDGAGFIDPLEEKSERSVGIAALFQDGRARGTTAIWIALFLCLLAVYTTFSWLPTMLTTEGLSVSVAGSGLTAYNLGGVFGALLCALAIGRFGSRWPMIACAAAAAASALWLQNVDIVGNTALLIFGLGVHGLFVNAVQSTLYAVITQMYPTRFRATGTATGLAFGRTGAILSAFVGAAVITAGGADAYLQVLGFSMAGVGVALIVFDRHIAPAARRATSGR